MESCSGELGPAIAEKTDKTHRNAGFVPRRWRRVQATVPHPECIWRSCQDKKSGQSMCAQNRKSESFCFDSWRQIVHGRITIALSSSTKPLSLATATYVVIGRRYGIGACVLSGLCMGAACALFWLGIEVFVGISEGAGEMKETSTPLKTKVEQLLTEARLIIPAARLSLDFSS